MLSIANNLISLTDLTNAVEQTFDTNPRQIRKKQQPYRVKVNGKYIVTDSQKTVWPNIGGAKNAIRNHLNNSRELTNWINNIINPANSHTLGFSWNSTRDNYKKQIIEILETNKIIEYVPYIGGE